MTNWREDHFGWMSLLQPELEDDDLLAVLPATPREVREALEERHGETLNTDAIRGWLNRLQDGGHVTSEPLARGQGRRYSVASG